MGKAEQFIKDYTKHCINIIEGYDDAQNPIIDYYPWLTPDQALRAVEIAREEIKAEIESLIKSYSPIQTSEGKYRVEAYKEVLDIINSNFLNISRSGNSHIGENGDLEKAAAGYAREQLANPGYPTYNDEYEIECAFEAGAQWQALHSLDSIKGMEEQAFLAGVEAEQINQNYGKDLLYICNQTSERTKKEFIDKACDWLADNYSKYIITNGLATIFSATIDFDTIRMIEDLKKAIEE